MRLPKGEFVHKIFNENTKEFSSGGRLAWPSRYGKIWSAWRHLNLHLGMIWDAEAWSSRSGVKSRYTNHVAVTYYMVPVESTRLTRLVADQDDAKVTEKLVMSPRKPRISYGDVAAALRKAADDIENEAIRSSVDI